MDYVRSFHILTVSFSNNQSYIDHERPVSQCIQHAQAHLFLLHSSILTHSLTALHESSVSPSGYPVVNQNIQKNNKPTVELSSSAVFEA